jgi:hypothetical protein
MVDEYRQERARQIEALGGFRNEDAGRSAVTFRQWLVMYYREQRALWLAT